MAQVSHKQLQANERENGETEDSQDHDVSQLLHGLNQRTDDGFQTCKLHTHTHQTHDVPANMQLLLTMTIEEFALKLAGLCSNMKLKQHDVLKRPSFEFVVKGLTRNYSNCFQGSKHTEGPQS